MATTDESLQRALQLHRSGDLDGAERLYREILSAVPEHADALHLSGLVALQRGQHEPAIRSIEAAIRANPRQADYHSNLAEAYRASGQFAAAIASCEQALALEPQSAAAHNNLGLALWALDRLPAAQQHFEQAVRLQPGYAQAQLNLGNALHAQARREEAMAAYRHALAADSTLVAAHHNLGVVLQAAGRYAEAADCYRQAVRLDPNAISSIGALAVSLQCIDQLAEAAAQYRRYLAAAPDEPGARINLATVLHKMRRFEEADVEYDRYVAAGPPSVEMFVQMGNCQQSLGKLSQAADCFRRAIALDPSRDESHFRLGAALLAAGDFEHGWPEYHWRLQRVDRNYPQPAWDGRALNGKRIVLYSERGQGLGDTLQFVRYAADVERRGGEVVLDVQSELLPLLAESGFQRVVASGAPILPACEFKVPLMTLPGIFGTDLTSIPAKVPYLAASSKLVAAWRERLDPHPGYRIGIHWHGSEIAIRDGRVIPLEAFAPLAAVPGTTLVSLQKKEGLEQVAAVADRFGVIDFSDQLDQENGALMDTAALMKNLDLVVTNDTVTAHLAGALAVPVWVALLYSAEWRWLTDRDDCPWYPSMRLFRQAQLEDWTGAFEQMAAELTRLVADRPGS